ncbi:hypothetical protein V492_01760, partial [Pseudogymnoascus sp. VKM F-4246]
MGTFVFKWEHPASEVIVTGTFDNWAQTEKLHRTADDVFEKEVTLPSKAEKIYYKVRRQKWINSPTGATALSRARAFKRYAPSAFFKVVLYKATGDRKKRSQPTIYGPVRRQPGWHKLTKPGKLRKMYRPTFWPRAQRAAGSKGQPFSMGKFRDCQIMPNPLIARSHLATARGMVGSQSGQLAGEGDAPSLGRGATEANQGFLVDGTWVTDHTAPQEKDNQGNLNNYLTTDRIKPHTTTSHTTPAAAALMSGVTPNSTTAALAKDVPKENGTSSALPGAFPETPATEPESFSVNPIPASAGSGNPITLAPGEPVPHPSTINGNTISSGVHDDEELKAAHLAASGAKEPTYSVAPIPGTADAGNPIDLAPGEPVPDLSTISGNTIGSAVRTDKESYEKAGGLGTAPSLPPVVTPEAERSAKGTGVLDLPSTSKGGLIPESSLAMGEGGAGNYDANPTIQSVGPGATTAALAGAVPLEKNRRAENGNAAIQSVGPGATTAALAGSVPLEKKTSSVPEVVKDSQEAANFPPEASAVPEEVEEKKEVERELLSGVPLAPVTSDDTTKEAADAKTSAAGAAAAVGAAAVAVGGAAFAGAAAAKDKVSEAVANAPSPSQVSKSIPLPDSIRESITSINETAKRQSVAGIPAATEAVPAPVRESISEAHQSPEAAAYAVPVREKKEVEGELLREVPTDVSKGE